MGRVKESGILVSIHKFHTHFHTPHVFMGGGRMGDSNGKGAGES